MPNSESQTTRRQADPEPGIRLILDAVRRLITESEIDSVSMDRIATEAGYTRRTVYAYFQSRDEVLLCLLTEDLEERWRLQREAITTVDTGLDQLILWAEVFYEYVKAHRFSIRLQMFWDARGIDPKKISPATFEQFVAINDQLAEGLRGIFARGLEDGSLRSDLEPDLAISQFLYSLRTILNRAVFPTYSFANFDSDHYVRHWLDLFIRAIRNRGDQS